MYYIMTIWQYNIWSTSSSTDFPQPLATFFVFFSAGDSPQWFGAHRPDGQSSGIGSGSGSIWTIFGLDLELFSNSTGVWTTTGCFSWPYDDGFPTKKGRIFVGMAGFATWLPNDQTPPSDLVENPFHRFGMIWSIGKAIIGEGAFGQVFRAKHRRKDTVPLGDQWWVLDLGAIQISGHSCLTSRDKAELLNKLRK